MVDTGPFVGGALPQQNCSFKAFSVSPFIDTDFEYLKMEPFSLLLGTLRLSSPVQYSKYCIFLYCLCPFITLTVFLNFGATDILNWMILCGGGWSCALWGVQQYPWPSPTRCQWQPVNHGNQKCLLTPPGVPRGTESPSVESQCLMTLNGYLISWLRHSSLTCVMG